MAPGAATGFAPPDKRAPWGFALPDKRAATIKKEASMGTFKDTEEAAKYFEGDKYARMTGVKLEELTDEYSLASLVLGDIHKNANGGIMGGAIFTLADLAFATLSNQIHMPTVAQQVSVNYLGAPKGEKLFAKAVCRKNGARTTVINVDVTDDTGRDIAQFIGSGFKLQDRTGSDRTG